MLTLPALWLAATLASAAPFQASDEACLELAHKIEDSMAEDQGVWLDKNFDVETMLDRARAAAKKAVDEDKTLAAGYWMLVTVSLRAKKYKETAEWLNAIEENLGIEFKDLTTIDTYADIVKSPEYADWLKKIAKGGGGSPLRRP